MHETTGAVTMANTPQRALRVHPDIWDRAMERAKAEGQTLTAVIVMFLTEYGSQPSASTGAKQRAKPRASRPAASPASGSTS